MLKSICLGIGLNMFFPEYLLILDAPPSVKQTFYKPGFVNKKESKGSKGKGNVYFNRTQNK